MRRSRVPFTSEDAIMTARNQRNPRPAPKPVVGAPVERETRATKTPDLPLPHDRDEATRGKGHEADPVIDQARSDIEEGKQETDLRGSACEVFELRWEGRRDRK